MLFKGNYLRVSTPRTTDGKSPVVLADGRIDYKEQFLPLTARAALELQNKDLPDILKKKIEIVGNEPKADVRKK